MTDFTGDNTRKLSPRTLAAQALGRIDPLTKAVIQPIHLATTYVRDPDNGYAAGYAYGRADNATTALAEDIIAALEGAQAALLFGSGMAAISTAITAVAAGGHVVAPRVMYTGTRQWLDEEGPLLGITATRYDGGDPVSLKAAIRPGVTRLVWVETPSNPLWDVTDLADAATLAHDAGALLVVDSTSASPVVQNPLTHGADIVMHAATKYLNGHSDVLAGALAFTRKDATYERIARLRVLNGAIVGPFEAYLLIRGMRTLHARVGIQCASALTLAQRLSAHPAIARVYYPGLPDDPGHAVALRQMTGGFGGMLSIAIRGGEAAAIAVAARVAVWTRATSLGGVESLIEHRASVEGAGTPCPTNVLRLSVGIEDVEDLWHDLDQALRG